VRWNRRMVQMRQKAGVGRGKASLTFAKNRQISQKI
jgi:hypothetical protein